jgi:hypothetical protein
MCPPSFVADHIFEGKEYYAEVGRGMSVSVTHKLQIFLILQIKYGEDAILCFLWKQWISILNRRKS